MLRLNKFRLNEWDPNKKRWVFHDKKWDNKVMKQLNPKVDWAKKFNHAKTIYSKKMSK